MLVWYHGIAMGLLFPYIPKKYKHTMYDVTITSLLSILPKLPIYSEIQAKIEFLAKKVSNIGVSPGFLPIKEVNDVSNIYCKIQDHTMKIFFKIVLSNIAGLHHPPPPMSDFDGLTYPQVRWYPKFFIKMTAKDVKETA